MFFRAYRRLFRVAGIECRIVRKSQNLLDDALHKLPAIPSRILIRSRPTLEDRVAHKGKAISGVMEGRGVRRVSRRVNGRQHRSGMPLKGKYRAILKEVSIPHNDMFPAILREVDPCILQIVRAVLVDVHRDIQLPADGFDAADVVEVAVGQQDLLI